MLHNSFKRPNSNNNKKKIISSNNNKYHVDCIASHLFITCKFHCFSNIHGIYNSHKNDNESISNFP